MQLRSRGRRTPPSLIPVQVGTPQCAVPDDEIILEEAKTMYTRLHGGDWLCYYTTERWIGNGNAGCMYFSNWNTALCEALWLAYNEWRDEQEGLTRPAYLDSEATFVVYIAQHLQQAGWHCRQEVTTPYGRRDLVAERAGVRWIIEAKLGASIPEMTCVLGQLLCAHETYPEAQLWFATPAVIPIRWNAILTRYNITLLEGPWTKAME